MFDLRARQQLNRGYSDGMARGMEIVITPLLMGFFGSFLDRALGTGPWLTVALGLLGVSGIIARLWIGYDRQMHEVEAGKPWTRGRAGMEAGEEAAS